MNKISKNEKGFGVVGVVIIVVIIAVLSVIGWLVYKNRNTPGIMTEIIKNEKTYTVNGPAMEPNYVNGQKVAASTNVSNVQINDVVIFNNTSEGSSKQLLKRVVALAGDKVVITGGNLVVYDSTHPNGFDPSASHVPEGSTTLGDINLVVPKGDIFVLGDNRSNSLDSRIFGPIPLTTVVYKVVN